MLRLQKKFNGGNQTILPTLKLSGSTLTCDDRSYNFSKRPLTLRLIKAFLTAKDHKLTRQQIVNLVYRGFKPQYKSERYNSALKQNIIKLISRARLDLETAFNDRGSPWIEFFSYNVPDESWTLYILKTTYIARCEKEYWKRAG